jgi:prepilin-type N-terminal cleavage/methylation domain-containing protein/prepilin-type processing-associated H-X9-DG protein
VGFKGSFMSMFFDSRQTKRAGFTLIELLVVISIIALLIGILLPALSAAQESARKVECMSNVRQLAIAVNTYTLDHADTTPDGHYNNVAGNTSEWDTSVGALLKPYLSGDKKAMYRCPSAADSPDDNYRITGDQPYTGTDNDDVFKPNYFYMATAQWAQLGDSGHDFRSNVWASRNAANLKLGSLPVSGSELLVFLDESTSHHTHSTNIYTQDQPQKHYSNFGYADGHVEGQRFRTIDGYMNALPPAIPQTQFGDYLPDLLPSQYE